MFTTPLPFAKIMLCVSVVLLAMALIGGANQFMVFYSSLCVILAVQLVLQARKS